MDLTLTRTQAHLLTSSNDAEAMREKMLAVYVAKGLYGERALRAGSISCLESQRQAASARNGLLGGFIPRSKEKKKAPSSSNNTLPYHCLLSPAGISEY